MDKKIMAILLSKILLNWPYGASWTFFKFFRGASPFLNLISSPVIFTKLWLVVPGECKKEYRGNCTGTTGRNHSTQDWPGGSSRVKTQTIQRKRRFKGTQMICIYSAPNFEKKWVHIQFERKDIGQICFDENFIYEIYWQTSPWFGLVCQ